MPGRVRFDGAMFEAVGKGDVEGVASLLDRGAPLDVEFSWGFPLHGAVRDGNLDMIRLLVERGADVDLPTSDGDMSLHIAAADGRCNVIDLLIELGATLDPVSFDELTPLLVAIWQRQDDAACRLVEHRADITCRDRHGNDALDCAIYYKQEKATALLCAKLGASCHERTNSAVQRFALVNAAGEGRDQEVERLLDVGVDIDTITPWGDSALRLACRHDDLRLVTLLLEHGASPDLPSQHHTPLMEAAYVKNRRMISTLIEAGADVLRSIDGKSWTAASFALEAQDAYLADYLRHLERKEKRRRKREAQKER